MYDVEKQIGLYELKFMKIYMEAVKLRKSVRKSLLITITLIMLTTATAFVFFKNGTAVEEKHLPISKINTDKKVIAIACNVYEGKEQIEKMLKVLENKKVKISFFFGGVWVKKNPETLIKVRDKGHDIQNHGYNHKNTSSLDSEKNIKEIKDTEKLIEQIAGVKTTLFEPPSGDYDDSSLKLMKPLGYMMVTWNIDTIDWRSDATGELIMKRIRSKLSPGSIILMHPKPVTAENLEKIIDYLNREGYTIKTVSELLNL
jgi:peptidoglycan/xylan/chitin deacetylase (PgdA/CDA1 family)